MPNIRAKARFLFCLSAIEKFGVPSISMKAIFLMLLCAFEILKVPNISTNARCFSCFLYVLETLAWVRPTMSTRTEGFARQFADFVSVRAAMLHAPC